MAASRRMSVESLIKDVLPLVLKLMPENLAEGFKIHIAGPKSVPPDLQALFDGNQKYVVFHGQVSREEVRMWRLSSLSSSQLLPGFCMLEAYHVLVNKSRAAPDNRSSTHAADVSI
jgi:hypothetical protein